MGGGPETGRAGAPLIALGGVTKRFGPVVANDDVSFAVRAGEVVALLGENGAGKSTLVNILSGLLDPDAGEILLDGRPVRLPSPSVAAGAGIGVVHQHFMLVPTLSAVDNIALGLKDLGHGPIDRRAVAARMEAVARRLAFPITPDARVEDLDVAHQQRIEIVKALIGDVRLLILDEPTAVLGPEDRDRLFGTVRRLRAEGTAVILITHKLQDVFEVADRVVVLRAGRVMANAPASGLTAAEIVRHMIGSAAPSDSAAILEGGGAPHAEGPPGDVVCRIRDLALRRVNGSVAVSGLDLDVRAGEIVAVAGVDGNGQSELVRCLAGLCRPDGGVVELLGARSDGRGWTARRLRDLGVAHIPEDRRRSGIVAGLSLARNYLLGHLDDPRFRGGGTIRFGPLAAVTGERIREFAVKAGGPDDLVETLSGGNQQKLVLAREIDGDRRLILAAHPSRGLDVKTIRFVHDRLRAERRAGRAVLLLSADLDEIAALADRVVVFAAGRVFGPADARSTAREALGAWIAGHEAVPA